MGCWNIVSISLLSEKEEKGESIERSFERSFERWREHEEREEREERRREIVKERDCDKSKSTVNDP